MTTFRQFVSSFAGQIRSAETMDADAVHFFWAHDGTEPRIAVGFGRQAMGADWVEDKGENPRTRRYAAALNGKADLSQHGLDAKLTSVTKLVVAAPDALVSLWRSNLGLPDGQALDFSRIRLIVEDASPDSCFGLFSLAARFAGVPAGEIAADWVNYIDLYERGFVAAEHMDRAYGELHNALVHASISSNPSAAWFDGLSLLTACLDGGYGPTSINPLDDDGSVRRAKAAFDFELRNYLMVRERWPTFQLFLPVRGFRERKVLIDCALIEERSFMGSHKSFARNDREKPLLKNGFTLMAVYRPEAKGDGNDVTVSLSAESGLSLEDFWQLLEIEEDRRWGPDRPQNEPRDEPWYRARANKFQFNMVNQPWYITDDESLVGAPGWVDSTKRTLGSKLQWDDVLETLWQTFGPFRDAQVVCGLKNCAKSRVPGQTERVSLYDCSAEHTTSRRKLRVARWHQQGNADLPLMWTPMLGKYLSACMARTEAAEGAPTFRDLMAAEPCSHLELEGAVCVIAESGAFFLVPPAGEHLDLAELKSVFDIASGAMDWIDAQTHKVTALLDDVRARMQGARSPQQSRELRIYNQICAVQLDVIEHRHKLDAGTKNGAAQAFRDELLRFWGVEGRLDDLCRDLEEAKAILTSHSDLVTNRRVAFLTLYGFPLALAANLFGFIFELMPDEWAWASFAKVHWMGFAAFATLALFGTLVMFGLSAHGDRKARLPKD
ncbi:MAG: hypothetical protein KKB37_00440 [Alphaproteobacteria bacterium]|nr:hypothetical protein [Alphaproteobacteria bacterium]